MASRRIRRRDMGEIMNTETFILAWYTDINDDGRTVFERIRADVGKNHVMFIREEGHIVCSKAEDGGVDEEYFVTDSETLNEMLIDDFDTSEIHNFYEFLCKRGQLCLTA